MAFLNSIVAANQALTGPDLREIGTGASRSLSGVNLVSSTGGSGLTVGVNLLVANDPLLAPLGWYGGPTQTMPPLAGSPAIDAAGTTDPTGTDQRGFPRFVDGDATGGAALDIGAVEAGPVIVVNTAADENDGITVNDVSLRDALAAAASTPVPGQRIVFDPAVFDGDPAATITLTHGPLLIPRNAPEGLVMDASNLPAGVTMDGNQLSRVLEIRPGNTVALHGLTLTGGLATGIFPANRGGAIDNDQSVLTLTACTLSGNSAFFGGGIYSNGDSGSATLTLHHSTLSGNSAANGGGIYNQGSNSGAAQVVLHQCTLAENLADGGAALFGNGRSSGYSAIRLHGCTVAANTATVFGAGIRTDGVLGTAIVTMENTIIADNVAPQAPDIASASSVIRPLGANLLSSTSGYTPDPAGTTPIIGNPLLAPLGDYGGLTQTMPPLVGSPAIDAAGTVNPGGTDQRGFPRFVDGDADLTAALDIGAVEAGPVIVVTTAADENDGLGVGGRSLREATSAATQPGGRILFDPAVFNGEPADVITVDSTLVLDGGALGEGVMVDATNLPSGVTVSGGGAVRIFQAKSSATVSLHGLTLTGGATSFGAAMETTKGAVVTMDRCLITGNGGNFGALNVSFSGSALALVNSTVANNTVGVVSGIRADDRARVSLLHSTVVGNTPNPGVRAFGTGTTVTLMNSLIAQNGGADVNASATTTAAPATVISLGGNLIGNDTQFGGTFQASDLHGTSGSPLDPVLHPLGDFGGPTQTMPPLPGSPAIDAAVGLPLLTDQRGIARPSSVGPDIGAVEFSPASVLVPLWSTNTDGDTNAYGIEFALGTSAQTSDPSHPNAFRITGTDASGKPKLTFGLNPLAAPYTTWIVRRSTTLQPNDWTQIYRYHGPSELETATGTTATPMGNLLEVVDDDPPPGAAFYRFEAEVVP